jgi:hypothetical protein
MSTRKQQKTKKAGRSRKAVKSAAPARAEKTPTTRERDPRVPAPGTTLVRVYKGKEHRLKVLADGFEYEGETFRSLTAAAKRATGYPSISGTLWWNVAPRAPVTPKSTKSKAKTAAQKDDAAEATPAAESPTT